MSPQHQSNNTFSFCFLLTLVNNPPRLTTRVTHVSLREDPFATPHCGRKVLLSINTSCLTHSTTETVNSHWKRAITARV